MSNQDSYTEVTEQSWFSRIGESIKGILFGLVLIVVAFCLLFWNEGRAVTRAKALEEGAGVVVSVNQDQLTPSNEGRLTHLSGLAETEQTLSDPVFGVSATGLKLERSVEMYQWQEDKESHTEKQAGGGTITTTTYSYKRVWSERLLPSGGFKQPRGHENPGGMPYQSETFIAGEVRVGNFRLPARLMRQINAYQSLPVDTSALPKSMIAKATAFGDGLYIGDDPISPRIGDLRIDFRLTPETEVSIVARQRGDTLTPYPTAAGSDIYLLETGIYSADEMFKSAQRSNTLLTWGLRIGGFVIMALGISLLLGPLSVLADVLPFLGNIVAAGTGLVAIILATVEFSWDSLRASSQPTALTPAPGRTQYRERQVTLR